MTQTIFMAPTISLSVDLKDWRTALRAVEGEGVRLDMYVEPGASRQAIGPYDPWRQRIKASAPQITPSLRLNCGW